MSFDITYATYALIAVNLLASGYAFQNRAFFERYAFWMHPIRRFKQYDRVISSAFLHVNGLHLLVNMYVLWMFGSIIERGLGLGSFLFIYIASMLGGNLWELWQKWDDPNYRAVGASGATSGLVLCFCLYQPFELLYLFFAIPVYAIIAGVGFIVVSFALSNRPGAMIAHGAHLGGALAGILATMAVDPNVMGNFFFKVQDFLGLAG